MERKKVRIMFSMWESGDRKVRIKVYMMNENGGKFWGFVC